MSVVLLVEVANSCVSGVVKENIQTFLIPILLTGIQQDSILYLFFISVFEVDITFWVKLVIAFWRQRWKQVCFKNYLLDDTLDNDTQNGDNNIYDNGDNHDCDENNDDK